MSTESVLDQFDRSADVDSGADGTDTGGTDVEGTGTGSTDTGSRHVDPDAADRSEPQGRPRQAVGIVAVVAVAVAGVGYSLVALRGDRPGGPIRAASSAARPSARPATPAVADSPSTIASPAPAALPGLAAPLLSPPAPWRQLADAVASTGRVDLARAAQIDGHGDLSRAALHKAGFVAGGSRSWQGGSAVLLVLDYTFRSSKAAADYVTAARRSRGIDPNFTARPVSGIPGVGGFDSTAPGTPTSSVIFSTGRTAYLLVLQGPPPAGRHGDVGWLAQEQYAQARR